MTTKQRKPRKHSHAGHYDRNKRIPGTTMRLEVCFCGAERVAGWPDFAGSGPWLTAEERRKEWLRMVTFMKLFDLG